MIREIAIHDDLLLLTEMLHRAYASQASRGLRFYASHQPVEATAKRIAKGKCFVAEHDGRLVGTICLHFPDAASPVSVFRDPRTYHFGQFGIEPAFKGRGFGRALHQHILAYAGKCGGHTMALDTAAPATDLIAMYKRWGYAEVGRHAWAVTNYESIIMQRPIKASADTTPAEIT